MACRAPGVITINVETGNAVGCWNLVSNVFFNDGDVIRIDTGNSGGAGNPEQRDAALAPSARRNGYVALERSTDPSSARRRQCVLRRPQ